MKIVNIDLTRRDNFKLVVEKPVDSRELAEYLACVYKEASRDNSVYFGRASDYVRDNDGRWVIGDDSFRCSLFNTGSLVEEPPKTEHWVKQYHANNEERELLIRTLEDAIARD